MTKRRTLLFAATLLGVIAADQVTKALVRASFVIGESRQVIPGVVWLTHVNNTGAAFGLFQGRQWLLVSVAIVVLGVIGYVAFRVCPKSRVAWIALGLVAAGAVGNLIDRVASGGVTDFIDFGWWPVFNVADIALDVGVALLVGWLLFSREARGLPECPKLEPSSGSRELSGESADTVAESDVG